MRQTMNAMVSSLCVVLLLFSNYGDAFLQSCLSSSTPRRQQTLVCSTTDPSATEGVRLNKAFKATHSRRSADSLIETGRVRVNGEAPTTMGVRLFSGDVVTLDGKKVQWERLNGVGDGKNNNLEGVHTYVKYWKPRGIECTTNTDVNRNIMDALGLIPGVTDRLWPMGRLDKDSTGLILITSDGPTTQRLLKSETQKWKTYLVETDIEASDQDIERLSKGVRIQSHISRDGNTKVEWVTTRDAVVERGPDVRNYRKQLQFKICEGKNRQLRRMCETVGLNVVRLHRVDFAGITLKGCPSPGTWAFLTDVEVRTLKDI
jgi:23S rRNA pseudouridine2604 synthase